MGTALLSPDEAGGGNAGFSAATFVADVVSTSLLSPAEADDLTRVSRLVHHRLVRDNGKLTSFESLSCRNTSSRTGFKPRLYLREVFVLDDLKMSEPIILLQCATAN